MIKVTIWNEGRHEKELPQIAAIYPEGIHGQLAKALKCDDLLIRTATLDDPEQGLPDSLLNDTDVLMWWGHCAHGEVKDELVERVWNRLLSGMGLIVMHSGHMSKIFRRAMGTSCTLTWRECGEKERVWTVNPNHPVAKGLPASFVVPHTEMYGERFDIPTDGDIVFISWYEGGNVFRSGVAYQRGNGRVFYFSPGHESYPIYYQAEVIKVLGNAIRWAAPTGFAELTCSNQTESPEKVYSQDPGVTVHSEDGKVL